MITENLAEYTRVLLDHNPALIIIGRENFDKINSTDDYIIVDEIFSTPVGSTDGFDGDTEQTEFVKQFEGSFTIDFFGVNARQSAAAWQAKHNGQVAHESQRDLGLTVHAAKPFRNLKNLEGTQYKERYQIELSVLYNETVTIDTLRIDTAEVTLIVDK